ALLNTSIIFCSSPTLIQVTSPATESSARSLSFRCATATISVPRARAARATSSGKTPLPAMSPSLFTLAANDSALRVDDEIDQPAHLGMIAVILERLGDRIFAEQLREEQRAGGSLDGQDLFGAEAAALESDLVDSGQPRAIARNHRVRRHILRDLGAGRDERVCTDAAELMHAAHALEADEFFEHTMSTELGRVHQDAIVADDAIVRDVHVGHHQHVVADQRTHAADFGAAMNRSELANGVVVADLERCGLTVKFQIRSRAADRGERKNSIPLTDGGERLDDDARADHRTRADFY